MAATDTMAKAGDYAQRLFENDYVQQNLADAAENLRGAYRRASKRRVEPTRDAKLHRQVREAALSLKEAASAFRSDRRKPKKRIGRRVIVVIGLGAAAGAVLFAKAKQNGEAGTTQSPSASDPREGQSK